ncbi:hypothetical protein BGZ76_006111 [Entomortierella beljakovae]|nr:hypothetical protein BGZ76_006111 [Entomortierella beljakovae]
MQPSNSEISHREVLLQWYIKTHPRFVDLIGDFGGSDLFVIEGDGLLFHFISNPTKHLLNCNRLEQGYDEEHAVTLMLTFHIEHFLHSLIERGAVFQVVFFDSHKLVWNNDPRLLAARECVIMHLSRCLDSKRMAPVLQIPSLYSTEWTKYLEAERPLFVLVDDGTLLDNQVEDESNVIVGHISGSILWKCFMHNSVYRKISVALLNNISFRDSKIIAFVFDTPKFAVTVSPQTVHGIYKHTVEKSSTPGVENMPSEFHIVVTELSLPGFTQMDLRLRLTQAAVMELLKSNRATSRVFLAKVLLAHALLIQRIPLSQRALSETAFKMSAEFRGIVHSFLDEFYSIIQRELPLLEGSSLVDDSLCDLLDERLFCFLAMYSYQCLSVKESSFLPAAMQLEFTSLWSGVAAAVDLSDALDDFSDIEIGDSHHSLSAKTEEDDVISLSIKTKDDDVVDNYHELMPFSCDILASHFASDKVHQSHLTTTDSSPTEWDVDDIHDHQHIENKHWHNNLDIMEMERPITDKWELRNVQTYIRFMHSYAASLTGVKGLYGNVITRCPKGNRASSTSTHQTSTKSNNAQKPSKKDLIIAENTARLNQDIVRKGQLALKQLVSDLDRISSSDQKLVELEERVKKLDSLSAHRHVSLSVQFIKLQIRLDDWIRIATKRSKSKNPPSLQPAVQLFVETVQTYTTFGDILSKESVDSLNSVMTTLGFCEFEEQGWPVISNVAQATTSLGSKKNSKALKESSKKKAAAAPAIAPTGSSPLLSPTLVIPSEKKDCYSVGMPLHHFQLKHTGASMDFSSLLGSKDDPRVPFRPDAWQRELLDIVDRKESALICAPTSSGKTFISYYAMEQILRNNDDDIVVYVAPTKALVNQVAAEIYGRFKKTYPAGNRSVWGIWTRDYRNDAMKCQVLVTVPAMLEILFLSPIHSKWAKRVKRVIFDEVHMIGSLDEGVTWEHLLLLCQCPILALSATVGNPTDFHKWLSRVQAGHGHKLHLVINDHRYSDLRKFVYAPVTSSNMSTTSNPFVHIHPCSALSPVSLKKTGCLAEVKLSPSECLELFDEMKAKKDCDSNLMIDDLDPSHYFSSSQFSTRCLIIDKANMLMYEEALKDRLIQFASASVQTVSHIIDSLGLESSKRLQAFDKSMETKLTSASQAMSSHLVPLIRNLDAHDMLPAIIFNFDRHACVTMVGQLVMFFEQSEEARRANDPLYQLRKAEAIRLADEHADALRKMSQVQMKRLNDTLDDDSNILNQSKKLFDWEKHDPEFTLVRDKNRMSHGELEAVLDDVRRKIPANHILIRGLERGIGCHHAGLPRKYLAAVETLFRYKHIRLVFSTGTLAMGINMPCKTSVFAGDSVFLTALNYRQMSGRAGRRGYDNQGNVVFYQLPQAKINRLLTSSLPRLTGHFPLSTTLVLRMLILLRQCPDTDYAKKAISGLLTDSLFCLGKEKLGSQVGHHLRFSIEYLRRQGLIDILGNPINMSGFVSHLYYVEPSNFSFAILYRAGVFHRICQDIEKQELDVTTQLMHILAHCFGHMQLPDIPRAYYNDLLKSYPSKIFLEPLPREINDLLEIQNNQRVLDMYTTYCKLFADEMPVGADQECKLPLSGTEIGMGGVLSGKLADLLDYQSLKYRVRSPFTALAGVGDSFDSIYDMTTHCRPEISLDAHSIPFVDTSLGESGQLNAYLVDFFSHGQISALEKANGLKPGNSWQSLKQFTLVLTTIVASLTQRGVANEADARVLKGFTILKNNFYQKFLKVFQSKQHNLEATHENPPVLEISDPPPPPPPHIPIESSLVHHVLDSDPREYSVSIDRAAILGDKRAQYRIGYYYQYGQGGFLQDYSKAMEWFLRSANQGYNNARIAIGLLYYHGYGVPQDYIKAMGWYLKAAEKVDYQTNGSAHLGVGLLYECAHGVLQNDAMALEWYLKAAGYGNKVAQFNIGTYYRDGRGIPQCYSKAMEWFLLASSRGYPRAQTSIGQLYFYGRGVRQSYEKSMEWFLKAANQGHSNAQFNIGLLFKDGKGILQDYSKAMEWFLRAANQGHMNAQYYIGLLYRSGHGVPKDYSKAMKWLLDAANQGSNNAKFSIGILYLNGNGVSQDSSKAMGWWLKAANQGHYNAQFYVGQFYENGFGVGRDYSKAMEWYLKAANQGNRNAQYSLGTMYQCGRGVAKDISNAREWYSKAMRLGHIKAKTALISLNRLDSLCDGDPVDLTGQEPYTSR